MKLRNLIIPAAAAIILGIVAVANVEAGEYNGNGGGTTSSSTSGAAAGAVNAGIKTDVTINQPAAETKDVTRQELSGRQEIANVPSVVAPALTTTLTETCMGSTSVGAAGVGFGFSFGTTWRDTACVRRLDSREVRAFSPQVAFEMMCDSNNVREAAERAAKKYGADKVPTCAPRD